MNHIGYLTAPTQQDIKRWNCETCPWRAAETCKVCAQKKEAK